MKFLTARCSSRTLTVILCFLLGSLQLTSSLLNASPTALSVSLEHWPELNALPEEFQANVVFFGHFLDRLYLVLHNDSVFSFGRDSGDPSFYLLGQGPNIVQLTEPTELVEFRRKAVIKLCSSYYHMLALTAGGEVYAWGWNGDGQLGIGYTVNHYRPIKVPLPTKMTDIACGYYSSYALPGPGSEHLYVWGGNNNGQLGLGHLEKQVQATEVAVPDVIALEFAYHLMYQMALTASGDVFGWGYGGARRPEPLSVDAKSAIGLAGTWSFGLILTGDGFLYRKEHRRRQPSLFYEGQRRFRQVTGDRNNRREFLAAETEMGEIVVWRDVRRGGKALEVLPLANMADAFGIFVRSPLLAFMAAPSEVGDRSLDLRCRDLLPVTG